MIDVATGDDDCVINAAAAAAAADADAADADDDDGVSDAIII